VVDARRRTARPPLDRRRLRRRSTSALTPRMNFHVAVAPTSSDGDAFNTIRPALMTVWPAGGSAASTIRLVVPYSRGPVGLRRLGGLRTESTPTRRCRSSAHAAVRWATTDFNRSWRRRAMAIYGVLTHQLTRTMWEASSTATMAGPLKSTQHPRVPGKGLLREGPTARNACASSLAYPVKAFQGTHESTPPTAIGPDAPEALRRPHGYDQNRRERTALSLRPGEFHQNRGGEANRLHQGCSEFSRSCSTRRPRNNASSSAPRR
jgi:hypothetical protein